MTNVADTIVVGASIRIRETKDVALITRMNKQCFDGYDVFETVTGVFFVATVDGKPAGFASVRRMNDGVYELTRAGVVPKHRRKGIQRKLIQARIRWAKRNNVDVLVTYTRLDNFASMSNLLKCGFKFHAPEVPWEGTGLMYFRKEIT